MSEQSEISSIMNQIRELWMQLEKFGFEVVVNASNEEDSSVGLHHVNLQLAAVKVDEDKFFTDPMSMVPIMRGGGLVNRITLPQRLERKMEALWRKEGMKNVGYPGGLSGYAVHPGIIGTAMDPLVRSSSLSYEPAIDSCAPLTPPPSVTKKL